MNEVSCKVFHILFRPLKEKRVPLEQLVAGTNVSVATLLDKSQRIDWTEYVAVMRNVHPHFTDDEYAELGREWMRSPGLRFAFVIARLLFSPMDFYRWMNKPKDGVGNQMFTCIIPSHRELSANEIEMDLTLPEGFEVCWDFYLISRGNMEELPRLLGLPRSEVTLTRLPRGGRFHIVVPVRVPVLRRAWRMITWPFTWPFTARAAARELKEAHETLLERYEQLEDARKRVARQATQLQTAHTVNDLIHGDLDVGRTLETIAKVLVEQAGFAHADISIPDRSARFGRLGGEEPFVRVLEGRGGRSIGELRVEARSGSDRSEREELLVFIVPTLAMALQNALDYQKLEEYQRGLEQQVDQRTAELRQARDELAGTVDQLREAQGARERFFANISHEIRTPLSLILLAVSDISARAGALLDARASAGLASVADAAHKLVRLVDELLLLAAGQEGKLRLAPEPTDVVALVEHLVAAWRPAAEAAGLELTSRTPASLVAVVDPVALERIATNLVSNAVKYTPRGGSIAIELADDVEFRLSVFDTGPGIGDELATRLFGRFERAAGEDRHKIGSGLGLSLVKQLVEAHGGTAAAIPRTPGPGSELRVSLPRIAVAKAGAAVAPHRPQLLGPRPNQPGIESGARMAPPELSAGTILLAEDDARLAEMVAQLLSDDYTVIVALDGKDAVRLVRQHQPQLLITDVDMPGLDGIQLAKQFREITNDALAPIIILSAVLDRGTRLAGLEAGAIDYITKPFDPGELRARVKAQFRMRDLALRLHRAEQLSALGILTSGLAHELRNPANGIVNAIAPLTKLLPAELTGPETGVGQLLEVMESCANQIGFLTRQLLSIRPGGTQLELQPADMLELVNRAVALAHRALAGVEVRSDLKVGRAVLCAPPLMVQVLVNLIENAGHAAGKGGWVEIDGRDTGDRLTVEIADSGPGVPLELRDRVFEPFFTTKPPGAGSGLGLPLARAIVLRHGGVLEIRERGHKPVFVVELPQHSAHERASNAV